MEIPTLNCSVCSCNIDPFDVKYHNAEKTAVFCDAYCSHEWYQKLKENKDEEKRNTSHD